MFVVILARGVPSPRYPLWGIFELDQARALRAAGHRVAIMALDIRSGRRIRRLGFSHQILDGIDVHTLAFPLGLVPVALEQALLDRAFDVVWQRIVSAHGIPDVVHAHFTKYALAASRSSNRRRFRLVVTEHNSRFSPTGIPSDLRVRAAEAYRRADAVIAVSEALAQVLTDNFDLPVRVVPNIVDVATFASLPRRPHDGIRLVSVGNLLPRKRMALLVEAFALAFADRPEVTLALMGEGPEREQIEQIVEASGLGGRVELLGHCPRSRIAEEFSRSDGFCLLSTWETFGVVFIEALAAGLPVLASRCGGPEGFLHEGLGLFVETDDAEAVAAGLQRFVSHFRDWRAEAIRSEAVRLFSPSAVAAQLTDVYAEVCAG